MLDSMLELLSPERVFGHLSYMLLIVSMLMTSMRLLRAIAIAAGLTGASYSFFWLEDPVGAFWECLFVLVNAGQLAIAAYFNSTASFNEDERAFHAHAVPMLQLAQLRRLVRIGQWVDAPAGTVLIREDEIVSHLVFLRRGQARVSVQGRPVGTCGENSLIGEISISTGAPATATVTAETAVRYLAFERKALERLLKSNAEIARIIEAGYRLSLQAKLVQMNALRVGVGT